MTDTVYNPWATAYNATVTSTPVQAPAAAPANSQQVFDDWLKAKAELAKWKAEEQALREQVVALKSDKPTMFAGTENIEVPGGKLKIVHKLNYKIVADGDKLDGALDKIEKSVEGGNVIADRLVTYKPELSVREYKLLNATQQKIIDECIEIKPASKEVTFEPTKGA